MSLMMRVSAFSGVELIGWCIMNNHFHIYVYLPEPPQMTDEEVLARFKALKGDAERVFTDDGSGFGTECPTLGASFALSFEHSTISPNTPSSVAIGRPMI